MLKKKRICNEVEKWYSYEQSGQRRCECDGLCGSKHSEGSCKAIDSMYLYRMVDCASRYVYFDMLPYKTVDDDQWGDPELVRLAVSTINDKPILLCQFCNKAVVRAEKKKKQAENKEKKRLASQDALPFKGE